MKLLMICHMAVPVHNAGGETTIHAAFRALVARGHEVKVVCRPFNEEESAKFNNFVHEGVQVFKCPLRDEYQWMKDFAERYDPDILLTHLDLTSFAMTLHLDTQKPLAHFVHNSMQFKYHNVIPLKCQLAIFNSHWVAEAEKWKGPQIVIHPIVEPHRYRCEKGTKITLINPTVGKGCDTFYALSKAMPDHEFLTVKSVYGEQIAPPNINPALHPNVETMEHTPDVREAFRKTKVLLMPSGYESYGRVAVEAACSGIPTIAHPTPGLLESLGKAGIFHDRDDISAWKGSLERLFTDDVYYRKRSDLALELANSLDPEGEFDRLEDALVLMVANWNKRNEVAAVKMWTPDTRLWETSDGKLVREQGGRIPQNAIRSRGLEPIPEEIAIANGLIPATEQKMEQPTEDKAVHAPAEDKSESTRKTRKKIA
jgi:hypothetical protein